MCVGLLIWIVALNFGEIVREFGEILGEIPHIGWKIPGVYRVNQLMDVTIKLPCDYQPLYGYIYGSCKG